MRLTKGLIVLAILLPYANGLTVGLTESDYSGDPRDGYIAAAIDRSDTVSSTVTLRITPMTYAEYNTRYSAALAIPSGCYDAQNSQFNNTPVQIFITPSAPMRFTCKIGLIDRYESQPPKSCFVIVLDVLSAGQQTVVIRRNVTAMIIYNSYPFTVSFETPEVTVNGDVGTTKIFIVKDNNQKVAYNFTLMLLDNTPPPIKDINDTYYSVEQLAIPFPADMQRVPVVIKVTNFNVSMDSKTLTFSINPSADYNVGQTGLVNVNIVNKNNVTVELENATHWLMVCLSVVDPILARTINLLIEARNITNEQVFFSVPIFFNPTMTRQCINVPDNGDFSTFLVTVTAQSNAVLVIPDRDIRSEAKVVTTLASDIVIASMPNYETPLIELTSTVMQSSNKMSSLVTSTPAANTTTQVSISLAVIATPTSSEKHQISRFESITTLITQTSQLMDGIATTHFTTMSTGRTSLSSNITGTAIPVFTPSPVVNKDCSWLIILIVTIACGLLCCLCCALAACLYVCLHHRAHEKAYFPASIEEHDERYHNWRCGNVDEVKLEEYKMLPSK